MKLLSTLLLLFTVLLSPSLAASEKEPWLQLTKSNSGFLFEGVEKGAEFSFDVPGTTIKTSRDGDRALASIDGVVVQVFRAEPPASSEGSSLAKYGADEAGRFESVGGKVRPSELCASIDAEHQEWHGVLPNGATSIFFATTLSNKLLVVVVASDAALSELALAKMSAVCASFKA